MMPQTYDSQAAKHQKSVTLNQIKSVIKITFENRILFLFTSSVFRNNCQS